MKAKLKFLNVFYLLFSVVALAAYFLNTNIYLRTTFNYTIDADLLLEESVNEDSLLQLGISPEDLFSDAEKLIFEVEVDLNYGDLLTAWTETGPDYDNYGDSDYSAIERYAINYVLVPALDEIPYRLEEDLQTIANAALSKMMENTTTIYLTKYCQYVTEDINDPFIAMYDTQQNKANPLDEKTYRESLKILTKTLELIATKGEFFEGRRNANTNEVDIQGYKDRMEPYFYAVKEPADAEEADYLTTCMSDAMRKIEDYLYDYGILDDDNRICSINEAIGTILQHLVDSSEFAYDDEDDDNGGFVYDDEDYYDMPQMKFINKFFSPLKSYVDLEGDSEFENPMTELLVNVISKSNINGENNRLFLLVALMARVFGVVLVLCLLSWAIKLIIAFISFFKQRPYIRINPFFIITGTIEGILAILTFVTMIIARYDMNTIRQLIPAIQAIVPTGLSIQLMFVAAIPGAIAILNLLFSILYGPVKRKFKEDARDEILYSTDFNDYE